MTAEQKTLVAQVGAALETLEQKCPGKQVEVWVELKRNETLHFTAAIGTTDSIFGYGDTPKEAVELALSKYDSGAAKRQRIERLKAELSKLEAE